MKKHKTGGGVFYVVAMVISFLLFACGNENTVSSKKNVADTVSKKDTSAPSSVRAEDLSVFERLNCRPLEYVSLAKTDSSTTGFTFKVAYNVEKVDSVSVNRHHYFYLSPVPVELVLYTCYDVSEYGSDFCMEEKFVPDSVRSWIRAGNEKVFLDDAFEKNRDEEFLPFNHFSGSDEVFKINVNDEKFLIVYFPCYYFGAQSWFDYQPVVFEFVNNKFQSVYFMPEYSFSSDPKQFTDFENDGFPEWICIEEKAACYSLKNKSVIKNENHFAETVAGDQGYFLKENGEKNWPCEIK
ncbi:MAG: hypothetical protein ACOZCO_17555 [Bacteroidota bacterium]